MIEAGDNNLTDKQLRLSYWYITHKLSLRKQLMIILILLGLGLWAYFGVQTAVYLINYDVNLAMVNKMLSKANPYLAGLENSRPQPLSFGSINALEQGTDITDFFIEAYNPNANWINTFTYQFVKPDSPSQVRSSFVMPGERKNILDASATGSGATFKILDQHWQKITNYESLKNQRFNLVVANENFAAGSHPGDPNIVTFDLSNNSGFGFWKVGIQAYVLNSGNTISSNYLEIEKLRAGETRQVTILWNHKLPRIDEIKIIPETNFVDPNNIMNPIK